ncbi:alanine racemase [Myxococcota bacterium]
MSIRPTVATVDLAAVRHNLQVIRRLAPGRPICAVVKANAYGHGLTKVGLTLDQEGVEWLGVALIEEGVQLRMAGVSTPILVLGTAYFGSISDIVDYDLVPAIFRVDQLAALAGAAQGTPARFHLKIDTGMARLGLQPDELDTFLDATARWPNLQLNGVMTHLASADIGDVEFTSAQLKAFGDCRERIRDRGLNPRWMHASNSAATLSFADADLGVLRIGLALYGLDPRVERDEVGLLPAMQWTTRPVHIKTVPPGTRVSYGGHWVARRPSSIATLPVGYADGYCRAFSNRASVLVRGRRAPVVGSVCMDLCIIDVTDISGVSLQDEVVLMGRQGDDQISAYDLAGWADTVPYEIICGVGTRVPRHHVDSAA